jgi:hypothetical protein
MAAGKDGEKRRAGGAIRVPFVRRCQLDYGSGQQDSAFIVNINVLGAYVESEKMPALGRAVVCRFQIPATSSSGHRRRRRVDQPAAGASGAQPAPGFGVAFRNLSADVRARIEQIVADYLARQSGD